MSLSALTIPAKAIAHNSPISENQPEVLENRLTRIAKVLQNKEKQLSNDNAIDKPITTAGWANINRGGGFANRSGGGGFANRSGGGGFANRAGGGGFLNKRGWRDSGGFINRRY